MASSLRILGAILGVLTLVLVGMAATDSPVLSWAAAGSLVVVGVLAMIWGWGDKWWITLLGVGAIAAVAALVQRLS